MAHETADIRNIALVGHAGAGKTQLTQALWRSADPTRARGGPLPASDTEAQAARLGHSVDTTILNFAAERQHVTLIDTPGYPDFVGRSLAVLEAVETAAVVVSAMSGIEAMTQRFMELAAARGLCRVIIVNKIDGRDARPEQVLAELREVFGRECLPLNLPADQGRSVVDCFFDLGTATPDFSSVAQAHTEILDQIVEMDEALMALYLEQGAALTPEQLHAPFEKALREGHLIPVCFTSAESGAGIEELLEVFARLMPNPLEANPPPFVKGEGAHAERVQVRPDPDSHVIAHVFKVTVDPFLGRIGMLRVHQGTVRAGAQLFVGEGRKPLKIAHLYRPQGREHAQIAQAVPGDICEIAKLEELPLTAVLHDSHDEDSYHLRSIELPHAMAGIAIEPLRRGEEQKLSDALHKLLAEDPCVRIESHAALHETVLYGMGDLHLRVMLERMAERYGVQVKTHPPRIPYRETITRPASGQHRHKKQTGGAGQFGEVMLRIEPLPRGSGFELADEVVGGAIPAQFIPAVEKGVRQALAEGSLGGFPLQDLRVIVCDGKHHPVDSKEVAFIAAGRRAFQNAVREASPIILEPIMQLEITVPARATGDVTGDLAMRRGRVSSNRRLAAQRAAIGALVPLAEIHDYQARLKSMTGGEGTYTMTLSHYDPVPPRRQQELVTAFKLSEESAENRTTH
jgi:elongation factor G